MSENAANVLLVADDRSQSEQLRQNLQAAGVTAASCLDQAEVGEALAASDRALVVYGASDISSSALQRARELKQSADTTPLLVHMTTYREVTRLRFLEVGADDLVPDEAVAQTVAGMLDMSSRHGREEESPATPSGDMYFHLKEGELSNALQFLCMTGRNGLLQLEFPTDETGEIYLADNTLVYASLGDVAGLDAVARMVARTESEAHFFEGREAPEIINQRPISQVLIEAAVKADELNAGANGI